ncbi:MAG: SDR family NAD(P)-dependent oxidoreductase, partial [Deltaproteobacteria bacterium]|nr:SDR family NAD(P)-dependent oxidoreductase [Deltaproteobacteria bacterium]
MKLAGQVAIVTGGSRGVGRAVALALAKEGADIVIAAKTDTPHARLPGTIHSVADEVRALGRKALAVQCNVREFESVENMRDQALKEFGRIDILINNAGAIHWSPVAEWAPGKF